MARAVPACSGFICHHALLRALDASAFHPNFPPRGARPAQRTRSHGVTFARLSVGPRHIHTLRPLSVPGRAKRGYPALLTLRGCQQLDDLIVISLFDHRPRAQPCAYEPAQGVGYNELGAAKRPRRPNGHRCHRHRASKAAWPGERERQRRARGHEVTASGKPVPTVRSLRPSGRHGSHAHLPPRARGVVRSAKCATYALLCRRGRHTL